MLLVMARTKESAARVILPRQRKTRRAGMNWRRELISFPRQRREGPKKVSQCQNRRHELLCLVNDEKGQKRSNQCSKSLGHARAMAPAGVEGLIADLLAQNPWHSILHEAWQEVNKQMKSLASYVKRSRASVCSLIILLSLETIPREKNQAEKKKL